MPKTPTPIGHPTKPRAFAPEASQDYGDVPTEMIAAMRDKLNARFGIGQGRMVAIDDPFEKAQ